MKENVLSIIIPIYNSERYIKKCIESILSQSNKNFELIIIDDGSTDNSIQILEEILANCSKNLNFRIHRQLNSGVSVARNKGIELSKGKYLFFVDSDDYLFENSVDVILKTIKKLPEIMVFVGDYNIIGSYERKNYQFEMPIVPINKFINNVNKSKMKFWLGSTVFNRDHLIKNRISFSVNKTYGEDLEIMYKSILCTSYVGIIPEKISNYNIHDNSLTTNYKLEQLDSVNILIDLISHFKDDIDQITAKIFMEQTVANNLIYNIKNLKKKFSFVEVYREINRNECIIKFIKTLSLYNRLKINYYTFFYRE